jgi:hypothetical protein
MYCVCSLPVGALGNREAGRMDPPCQTTQLDGQSAGDQRLFERLEAENARLRGRVVDLMLQIQALRDGASPCRHPAGFR